MRRRTSHQPKLGCRLCRVTVPTLELQHWHEEWHERERLRCTSCGAVFVESDGWRDMGIWTHLCGEDKQGHLRRGDKYL